MSSEALPLRTCVGLRLRLAPPGDFVQGRVPGDGEYAHLNTPRPVTMSRAFWMSETPVTNGVYRRFLEASGYKQDLSLIERWDGDWIRDADPLEFLAGGDLRPVVGVSFTDAVAFCAWASSETGDVVRLPSEAEFEYAAKAGCDCTGFCARAADIQGDLRPYGAPPMRVPPEVSRHGPNRWGLYGMNGLIWQWCSDWFWTYEDGLARDPLGPDEPPPFAPWKGKQWKKGRVIRGGSFAYGVLHARCATRHYSAEPDRNFNLGFRVAVEE